jgi:hypothetical protein
MELEEAAEGGGDVIHEQIKLLRYQFHRFLLTL